MRYLLIIIAISIFAAVQANAQSLQYKCDTHAAIKAYMLMEMGQANIWHGLAVAPPNGGGITVRIYQNDDTGNWTTTMVRERGIDEECIESKGVGGVKMPFVERPTRTVMKPSKADAISPLD